MTAQLVFTQQYLDEQANAAREDAIARIPERIAIIGDELLGYLSGRNLIPMQWHHTVPRVLSLMTDVGCILPTLTTQPVWLNVYHYEVIRRYLQVLRRVSAPRVKPQLGKMNHIQRRIEQFYKLTNITLEGITEMTTQESRTAAMSADDVVFQPADTLSVSGADLSEAIKNRDITLDSKLTDIYGDRDLIVPAANLRKDPAYQLSINGCGRVAMRFTGSRLGWINDITMHVDIAADNVSVRDDVIEVLSTVEFVPFENHSAYENDAALAQEQLTKFIAELQTLSVLERPEYSAEICFISIIPTVRQSWATDGHGNPV